MPSSADILNHALSQQDRLAQAPDPSRVRVDDRSLAHLLSLAVDHGKFITFYDLTNAPDGDWSALFSTDPAIALALQASLDPNAIEQEMQAIGRRLRQDDRPLVRPEPWQDLVALIRHLLTTLRRRALREGPLATLLRQVDSPVALVDSAINLSRFLESTGLDLRLGVQPILLKETELRRLENLLRDFLGVLLATLDTARQDAARDLQVELTQPGHSPHVALYIAFARLFQSTQARLNGFPDALLRFYHQQVLRQETIPDNSLRPDHLLLAFRRKPGADTVLVPRQTPFSAGVDGEGLPVIFATDQDLEVQASELRGMVTMRVRGRVRQIDGTEGLAAVDAVWLTAMTLPLPYPAVGPVFPLFGHDQPRQTPCGDTSRGVLGFAIASPLLLLEGGQRLVQLTLRITPPSLGWLAADSASRDPDALRERIRQSLEQALSWEYTTAAGLEPLSPRARARCQIVAAHDLQQAHEEMVACSASTRTGCCRRERHIQTSQGTSLKLVPNPLKSSTTVGVQLMDALTMTQRYASRAHTHTNHDSPTSNESVRLVWQIQIFHQPDVELSLGTDFHKSPQSGWASVPDAEASRWWARCRGPSVCAAHYGEAATVVTSSRNCGWISALWICCAVGSAASATESLWRLSPPFWAG